MLNLSYLCKKLRQMTLFNQKYMAYEPFVRDVHDHFENEGTYVYGGRRNLIKSFEAPDGQKIVVKRYGQRNPINRLVYSAGIRKPKGLRAFEYASLLLEKGIETPDVVAYIEERRCHLLGHSYLVSMFCPFEHTLYDLESLSTDELIPLAHALARFVANMHDHGVVHLDFSPGNILWEHSDGEYRFSVVDINRMWFGRVDMKTGCRSFERLMAPTSFLCALAHEYARLRGFDDKQAVALTLKYNIYFQKYIETKSRAREMRKEHHWHLL